jgi:NO-binding membrane sensor protein with MHYT domain
MRSSSLIWLGSMAAMVCGVASTMLGLLYVLLAQGLTLGSIENALLKGNYKNPVLTTLLVGVLAGIAAMHVLQRQHFSLPGALVYMVAFVGVAMTVGANL